MHQQQFSSNWGVTTFDWGKNQSLVPSPMLPPDAYHQAHITTNQGITSPLPKVLLTINLSPSSSIKSLER